MLSGGGVVLAQGGTPTPLASRGRQVVVGVAFGVTFRALDGRCCRPDSLVLSADSGTGWIVERRDDRDAYADAIHAGADHVHGSVIRHEVAVV